MHDQHTTSHSPGEAHRAGALGELDAVGERLEIAAMCQERQRRLLVMADGHVRQAMRLRSGRHPNRYVASALARRLDRRAADLLEIAGLLEAQSLAQVHAALPHVANARTACRIDQLLANQLRLRRAGLDEDSLVGVA